MAMIESVQARHHGSHDFEGYYTQLCALQDTCPLTSVKAHLSEGALDLNADRIRLPDWTPILNALRINKNLEFIGVRSYYQQNGQETSGKKLKTGRRPPPIRSKEVSYRLCVAIRESLAVTTSLTFIELQGIPLRSKDVQALTKGIVKNTSLQHLSVEGCRVGDRGLDLLTHALKNSPSITSLNFSACGVTTKGAECLAKLIKHQSTKRHSEAWKDSLRYRRPDLDRMAGIRRLTLNSNPLICDDGAMAFAESLRDDLWLKALDLQQCGISNIGAKAFLDALHENATIVVLDIRKNPLIDRDMLKAVMEQVMINGGGKETEYKWLHTSPPKQRTKSKRSRTKPLSNNISKKHSKRANGVSSKNKNTNRSRSPGGALVKVVPESYTPRVTRPGPGFVPWRTAARASQRSMAVPIDQVIAVDTSSEPSDSTTPTRSGVTSIHVHAASSTPSSDQDTSHKDTSAATPTTMMSSMRELDERETMEKRRIKDMQVEIEELRRRFYIESRARAAADARVVELEVDNSRLKHQIQLLEARSPGSPLRKQPLGENGMSDLDDDGVLDSIEESFQKFHGFLDLLREAGLGQLCNLVGLGPQDLNSPTVASILQNHQPYEQPAPAKTYSTRYTPHTTSIPSTIPLPTASHPSTVYHPPDALPQHYQTQQSSAYVPSSIPATVYSSSAYKQDERTLQYRNTMHNKDSRRSENGRSEQMHTEPKQHALPQEPRLIHSKPLVSPPEPSGTSHPQTSYPISTIPGSGGSIMSSRVQATIPVATPGHIESSGLYQASSAIGRQGHPPHASLLPPASSVFATPMPATSVAGQSHLSQGVTVPMTQPTTQFSEHVYSATATPDQIDAGKQTFPQSEDSTLKDILLSKEKDVYPEDSTSVIVGSVLSFTNPERTQLQTESRQQEFGDGDAKHVTKPSSGGRHETRYDDDDDEGRKDISKGSASEDDYEDDFMPSSDTGSKATPRNMSDKTSTPTKSSMSHRTYSKSSRTGSDYSDIEEVRSLGSSIHDDIGETPSPNQGKQKSDESSDEDF